ncbi:flagella synthesis protein FlgN [Chromatium okenii]|jgi:flagella synthesis protein FlgN|uniref:Flagellar biosynthesis protein FlgN n=1 Tax=Chromatium okenii TaxID=61644 RepID=A0A2S7XNF2_9GAMM|nr:flagellar protein FlgN [Chromatium okenii]PQJ95269.1 flagellar biosynthesis protein FlgN [Chromatium okenii]
MTHQPTFTGSSTQFAQSLVCSLRLLTQLETVMLEEARVIATRKPDALQHVVTQKSALVVALEAETAKQKQWVESAQLPFSNSGVAQFFTQFENAQSLNEQWGQLREIGMRCDQLNRANARLIEHDRKRIATLLRILKGDDTASTTYTPQGRTASASSRSRTLIHA